MQNRSKPKPLQLAVIREEECIGCTKCIKACPVDAILGAENQMHTVISEECIGCKLCLPPCPVDCIDLVKAPDDFEVNEKSHILERVKARKLRLKQSEKELTEASTNSGPSSKKSYILNAIIRGKRRKGEP